MAAYCLKSKSEALFDSIFGRKALTPIQDNGQDLLSNTSLSSTRKTRPTRNAKTKANVSLSSSITTSTKKKSSRTKRQVKFKDDFFDETIPFNEPVKKYTKRSTIKKVSKSTTDAVYEAFCKSNLPDFDALPELNIIDVNKWEVDKQPVRPDPHVEDLLAVFESTSSSASSSKNSGSFILRNRRHCMTPQEIVEHSHSVGYFTPQKSVITTTRPCASVYSNLNTNCMKNVPQSTPLHQEHTFLKTDIRRLRRTIVPVNANISHMNISLQPSYIIHSSFAFAFGDASVINNDGEEDILTDEDKLLALCSPSVITSFDSVFTPEIIDTLKKLGEGSYAEVYGAHLPDGSDIVLKIIPFETTELPVDEAFSKLLPELVIFNTFNKLNDGVRNRTPNFIRSINSACVQGKFPSKLLAEWDAFDEAKGSENLDPRQYTQESLHLVIVTNNGGIDLETFKFNSAEQALSVFLQVAFTLAAAEAEFQFEHRDLHWGNILISKCEPSTIDYSVNGLSYEVNSNGIMVQIIDFTLSRITKDGFVIFQDLADQYDLFNGLGRDAGRRGDYQFDIYRSMKEVNGNNWQHFTPKTNTLWLDYLIDKLINFKKYRSRNKEHKMALDMLKKFHPLVQAAPSASSLISSSFVDELLGQMSN